MLTYKEIEEILNSTLVLDALEISLIQQTDSSPRIYRGPGTIYQDKEGILRLKMYHTCDTREEMLSEVSSALGGTGLSPGKIIEGHHYFALEAKDMSGRVWREDSVWLSGNLSLPAGGKVVEARLRRVTCFEGRAQEQSSKTSFFAVVPGSYRLPFNEAEKAERSSSLSACRLAISGGDSVLKNQETHLEISADIPNDREADEFSDLFLEALSIGIGKYLCPVVRILSNGDERITSIHSRRRELSSEELLPPVPTRNPHHAKGLNDLVTRYLEKITEPYSPMFGYWFRLLGESSGELENRALVLTTCIEGIIKEYYPDAGMPDAEFLSQVADALKKLKSVDLGKRARDRIQSTLGNAKSASPKGALYEMAKKGLFSEKLVEVWVELRNKSAHADQLRKSDQELQDFLDEVHGCIELFYILLLAHIEYVGEYFQYSKDDWPVGIRTKSA